MREVTITPVVSLLTVGLQRQGGHTEDEVDEPRGDLDEGDDAEVGPLLDDEEVPQAHHLVPDLRLSATGHRQGGDVRGPPYWVSWSVAGESCGNRSALNGGRHPEQAAGCRPAAGEMGRIQNREGHSAPVFILWVNMELCGIECRGSKFERKLGLE